MDSGDALEIRLNNTDTGGRDYEYIRSTYDGANNKNW